jgi:hypothetical protein
MSYKQAVLKANKIEKRERSKQKHLLKNPQRKNENNTTINKNKLRDKPNSKLENKFHILYTK